MVIVLVGSAHVWDFNKLTKWLEKDEFQNSLGRVSYLSYPYFIPWTASSLILFPFRSYSILFVFQTLNKVFHIGGCDCVLNFYLEDIR